MENPKRVVEFKNIYRLTFNSLESASEYYQKVKSIYPEFFDCRNEKRIEKRGRFVSAPKELLTKEGLMQLIKEIDNLC